MATGWVSIYRDLQDHWLWEDKPFSRGQAWIDLILLANRQDGKMTYKGEVQQVPAGTVCRSILWLSERWGWSRKKTRSFINMLETDGMVATSITTNQTLITLVNYELFQGDEGRKGQRNRQRKNIEGTAKEQRGNTYNNVNKENNENNIYTRTPLGGGAMDEEHLRRLAR